MSSVKGDIYQRGPFWLDYARGAGGKLTSPFLYINWYDSARGRQRRKSTGTGDVQLASDALDAHFLATHRPTDGDRREYGVAQAMTDYYLEVGITRSSAASIKARLLLFTRFMVRETEAGRLPTPFLPEHVDDALMMRFREWGKADPIVARSKNDEGQWVREGAARKRSPSTVEESVIQLKAALNHAKNAKRIAQKVEVGHLTRNQVTAARNDRLSVSALGELLDYAVRGGSGKYSTPERLIGLRRYLIAAVATLGRPDSILDISVRPNRSQWLADDRRLDLNPAGRIQTKKYRAVLPVGDVFAEWLNSTTDWFVCAHRREADPDTGEFVVRQIGVDSVRSAWDTARDHLKLPAGWGTRLLRHSVATILANRGINPVELKIAMGHEAIVGTTARYVIFDPSYLVSFQRLVDELFVELGRMAPSALNFPSP